MAQKVNTLTIAIGQTESPELVLHGANGARALTMNIISPAILPETVNIEIGDGVGGTYGRLRSGAVDIELAAGRADPLDSIVAVTFKLVATGSVAADRAFIVIQASRAYE